MGCWNGTCLISNLPVYVGDEVVFFILKRKCNVTAVEGGHYSADDIYESLPYPIVGEYDDYGCIENVKEDFSLIEEYFENVERTQDKWDQDNDVFRNIERGNYKGYTFALIHKDIYDALIEHMGSREEWWSKGKNLRDFVVEEIEKQTAEYFRHGQLWERGGYFVAKYLKTQDDVLRNKLIEARLIHVVLSLCRKFWFPQTGAGSQNNEIELYAVLANKMLVKCRQTKEKWGRVE